MDEPGTAATAPALTIAPCEGTDDMSDLSPDWTYRFKASCPRCGGPTEHRRSVVLEDDHSQAECWCATCLVVWRIDVGMTAIDDLGSTIFAHDREAAMRQRAGEACSVDLLSVFG